MNALIDSGVDKAAAGDREGGAADVNSAYYGYYEKLGFEKTVMSAISGDRVSEVENQFKVVRKAMVGGDDIADITADAETLKTYLTEDAATLDGGAAENISPLKAFLTGSFGQAFLILLREGLEAILVVAAVIAYLLKAGMRDRVKYIYAGLALGLAGSGVVALLFAWLYDSASAHQEILEGAVALIAMVMLLFTSNWMLSKSSVASWNRYIKDKTEASISDGGFWALASLSFLAVFREGAETVMFYEALFTMDPSGSASIWQGFAAGAVVLVLIFLLIRFTSVRIPLRPFFAITSFLMAVLVVIFAGGGAHALIEGDIIPATYVEGWPTYDYLGLYPYRETLLFQAFMAALVVVLSAVSVLRHRRVDAARAAQTDTDAAAAKSGATE
ncbi:FTR1 family iron permease [Actinomyces ruminis]|uniref:FTR1 family iron permease n=1 Tax=Actinomyces ruminis TaxID=1937003 RepID=UPI000B6CE572|nr:FTR1 family protein [Actinomyces ruminis]